jgi:hypothetical protein
MTETPVSIIRDQNLLGDALSVNTFRNSHLMHSTTTASAWFESNCLLGEGVTMAKQAQDLSKLPLSSLTELFADAATRNIRAWEDAKPRLAKCLSEE